MNFLGSLAHFFTSIKDFFSKPSVAAAFDKALSLVPEAIPVVEQIAALTPTRTDDEIIAAFKHFFIPLDTALLAVPQDQRGMLLFNLAVAAVQKLVPAGASSIIGLAVQAAVTALKHQ
jgi:hypothetical protein